MSEVDIRSRQAVPVAWSQTAGVENRGSHSHTVSSLSASDDDVLGPVAPAGPINTALTWTSVEPFEIPKPQAEMAPSVFLGLPSAGLAYTSFDLAHADEAGIEPGASISKLAGCLAFALPLGT